MTVEERKNIFKDAIGFDPTKKLTNDIELDVELEEIKESGERQNPETTARQIIKHLILKRHAIGKDEISDIVNQWQKFRHYNLDVKEIRKIIDSIWSNKDMFREIKSIAHRLGIEGKQILLDKGQIHEVAEWLKGRYHIKRIDIDGKLLFFNDKHYEQKADDLIRREARECLILSTKNDVNEILSYIEDTGEIITLADIMQDIHLKCLLNGIYNIKTGEFSTGFDPEHIILNQIPHHYKDDSSFEILDKVVREIIANEKNTQSLYDFLSTCLHPYTGIDFQFGGIGQSGTGKSQICDLVVLTLGEDNVSDASIHTLAKDPTTQIDVAYKMCNVDREMSANDIKETSMLKKWITQDRFRNRAIFEHSGDFRPTARLMFMTNNLYEMANHDDADAMYERTHLITIETKHRGTVKEINKIMEKTATVEQLEGLITYLLKNTTEIYQMQKIHHPMTSKQVEDVWNRHGNRIREFIKKWCVKGVTFATERGEVWDKWLGHALDKEFPSKGRDTFYEQFEEIVGVKAVATERGGMKGRYYIGIRLISDQELGMKETDDIQKE